MQISYGPCPVTYSQTIHPPTRYLHNITYHVTGIINPFLPTKPILERWRKHCILSIKSSNKNPINRQQKLPSNGKTYHGSIAYYFFSKISMLATRKCALRLSNDPNSVGVRISGVKAIFTECYGFEHFINSTMPINPRTII